ncbi:Dynein heavy chain 7, axonemal [Hondaea fermentalgiana]|uniref:Dynein heavy chain 7, axonemal n=1 Tax=Hondaea fermentalgiana TaxID=2315210 RepID=A0A2R5GT01_9STRA|nr:Dynein heavy chain 7, axonemal [Hondaea fermentalgiana]|eukprot:GBG32888.1 Dynein heavy chain 7, axonemal [Hondaea fermentalgiana]
MDSRVEDATVFQLHHAVAPEDDNQDENDTENDSFQMVKAHVLWYTGGGKSQWQPCILRDFMGDKYLVSRPEKPDESRWVTWTRVWRSDQEPLTAHQTRMVKLRCAFVASVKHFITDVGVPNALSACGNEACDPHGSFLGEIVGPITPQMTTRLVLKAKPLLRPFRSGFPRRYGASINSPTLWRGLLEEVHDAFLQAQYLAGVRWRLKSGADETHPVHDEKTIFQDRKQSKVKRLARIFENKAFVADPAALAALGKIHRANLDFEESTVLFDLSFAKVTAPLFEFSAKQDTWIDRVGPKTRSSWIVAIYDVILQHIAHKPRFAQNTGPHGDLARFLRLVQLSIRETLSRIVGDSLEALERVFVEQGNELFAIDMRMERLTRAAAMRADQSTKERSVARRRLTMLSDDWITMDFVKAGYSSFSSDNSATSDEKRETTNEIDAEHLNESDHFQVDLFPPCNACIEAVQMCVRRAVGAVQTFPRIDALVLDDPYTPENEKLDLDSLLAAERTPKEVAQRISQSLAVNANASESHCQRLQKVLQQRVDDLGALEKAKALEDLGNELKTNQEFGAFILHLRTLKDKLRSEAGKVRKLFFENVLASVLERCADITHDYEEARARLTFVARSSKDLEGIMKELTCVPGEVARLEALVSAEVRPSYMLFERERFVMRSDDWAAYWRVAGLPKKLALRADRVRADIASRKKDICTELEDAIARHRKRLTEYERLAAMMSAYNDLRRTEEYAMNAGLLEENVVAAHEKTKELVSRCAAVGLEEAASALQQYSSSLLERVVPVAALWTAAADVSEMHAMWHRGSLLKLDVNDTIERVRCIQEGMLPQVENFAPQVVTDFLQSHMQEIRDTEQLVRALTSRGLQHYHWADFAERHKMLFFQPTYETSLEKVIRSHPGVLEHLEDLIDMAEVASTEFRNEQMLDDMETQLKRLVDDTDTEVWQLEVLVAEHLLKIREMRSDARIESLWPRMRVWEDRVTAKLASASVHAQECQRARMQVIASWRRHEPRLCFLSDEDLFKFFPPPRLCDLVEDILHDTRTSPQLQDPFRVLHLLYAWYALPALMQGKPQPQKKRNLFAQINASKSMGQVSNDAISADDASATGSGHTTHTFFNIFNDANERFSLSAPCSALSLDGVDHFVGAMVKETTFSALQQLRSIAEEAHEPKEASSSQSFHLEEISPTKALASWMSGFPKQILVLTLRIMLSDLSSREVGTDISMAWLKKTFVAAKQDLTAKLGVSSSEGKGDKREIIVAAETLVAIMQNHEDISKSDPEAVFQFAYDESCDNVKITFEDFTLHHGFEVARASLPPLLYFPSMRWHFAVTRVFHRASESILLEDHMCGQVGIVARELGRHCRVIPCESLEDLMRVQQGVRRTKWWTILQDRCSWGGLLSFSPDPRHLVFATRKSRLPPALSAKLRPCAINVNETVLQAQGLLAPSQNEKSNLAKQLTASSQKGAGALASDGKKMDDQLALYMTEFSDARDWDRQIKRFLRRVSKDTWAGAPSRIVIHDAQRANGEVRNTECMDLISRWQDNSVATDVEWVFVNRHSAAPPHIVNASDLPDKVECLTLVLLAEDETYADNETCSSERRVPWMWQDVLRPLVQIPNDMALQAANDRGKSEALKVVCFENSDELARIEEAFPCVRRVAARVRVTPWWLSREKITKRSSSEDTGLVDVLVQVFLEKLLGAGTAPEEFFRLEKLVREALPSRLREATAQCDALTQEKMSEASLSSKGGVEDGALAQALQRLVNLPRQVALEACETIISERKST